MMETMKFNWNRVCQQLKSDVECTESVEEREVLLKIEKNVYHRKTASPVVITEVCILLFPEEPKVFLMTFKYDCALFLNFA